MVFLIILRDEKREVMCDYQEWMRWKRGKKGEKRVRERRRGELEG